MLSVPHDVYPETVLNPFATLDSTSPMFSVLPSWNGPKKAIPLSTQHPPMAATMTRSLSSRASWDVKVKLIQGGSGHGYFIPLCSDRGAFSSLWKLGLYNKIFFYRLQEPLFPKRWEAFSVHLR
ncbi:hypothetical protein AMECASPLE_008348 [Ameca splendens]|uniref:Uncharacterized protein n=1 Tax=Ameca splendens TaxID=208324 RepID=A0ABV1A750_9TELE